jgi:hypothetical protein
MINEETMMGIIGELTQIRTWSEDAWDMAVDTAGPEYDGGSVDRAAEMRSAGDECLEEYDAAIETLRNQYDGWARDAREHLLAAKRLESDGGDSSHAQMAIEALDEYLAQDEEDQADGVESV